MKKVALVTGASNGIGKEIAKLLLKKDYSLVLSGRNEKGFDYTKNTEHVDVVIGDITRKEMRDRLADLVTDKYGRLDLLVNNAGITFIQPLEENTEEQLNSIYEINLKTPILLTQQLYPIMKKQNAGTIAFINSSAGKQGYPNHTMYSTMKFGLNGFSQALRMEAKKHGIRVISVHPGGVNTGLYSHLVEKPDVEQYMSAEKLAQVIVYLCETEGLSPDEITINRMTK